jgi:hypothetical protein
MAITKLQTWDGFCGGCCGWSMPSACKTALAVAIALLVMAGTSPIPATDYRAAMEQPWQAIVRS